MKADRGFTLLEVMVAVAILAIAFSAIFGGFAGAIATNTYVKRVTIATMLARLKMTEIETKLMKEGFGEIEESEQGDFEEEGFRDFKYDIKIEEIELPSLTEVETLIGEELTSSSIKDSEESEDSSLREAIEKQGGVHALSGLMPMIGEVLKEAVRKVTVEVKWKQRGKTKKVSLVQYITNSSHRIIVDLINTARIGSSFHGIPSKR
jgi:general secretion pathway protein I